MHDATETDADRSAAPVALPGKPTLVRSVTCRSRSPAERLLQFKSACVDLALRWLQVSHHPAAVLPDQRRAGGLSRQGRAARLHESRAAGDAGNKRELQTPD